MLIGLLLYATAPDPDPHLQMTDGPTIELVGFLLSYAGFFTIIVGLIGWVTALIRR